ncbi:glycoside hydrolase [Pseudonocardiaceae bacterium YIM PH 21723]|nr:glycoside hydrolase [Pseudonocardiaceae bacterium YIM PH 21723]
MKRTMRGLLAATALIVSVSIAPGSMADPDPTNASDALKQYQELSKSVQSVVDQKKKVEDDIDAKKRDAENAKAAAEQAIKDQEQYRGAVDQIAAQAYTNGQMNSMSALLVAKDPSQFLDQMSALDVLSHNNQSAITDLQKTVDAAAAANKKLQDSINSTAKLRSDLEAKQAELAPQIAKVEGIYNRLSGAELAQITGNRGTKIQLLGNSVGTRAAMIAQDFLGVQYVWGGTTPSPGFDCSGLVQWAYNHAGRPMSRSTYTQVYEGTPVSRDNLQAGDLIFLYGNPPGHVGIYLAGGKYINAPTTGDVVKIVNVPWGDVTAMRHIG